jgi:hypothetical protein
MKRISFWKKVSLYFTYRKILMDNKLDLEKRLNIRLDRTKRLYTVFNIPPETFGEYNLRTSDIARVSEPYIQEYLRQLSRQLDSLGLKELYDVYDVSKVDKYSFLIIIGFSLFNTTKIARNLWYRLVPSLVTLSILFFIYFKLIR